MGRNSIAFPSSALSSYFMGCIANKSAPQLCDLHLPSDNSLPPPSTFGHKIATHVNWSFILTYVIGCSKNWKTGCWLTWKPAARWVVEPWAILQRWAHQQLCFYILLKLGSVPVFLCRSIVIVFHSWYCEVCPFSFPDALCYQIRGKHVFPNAMISQRYKLQLYHIEKGMQSAPFSISTEKVYRIQL